MTISIRQAIQNKPSVALAFMVEGLKTHSKRELFRVHMDTYGSVVDGVCYGCAATCTIQQIAGKALTPRTIFKRHALGFDHDELREFESGMDTARTGQLDELFDFCDLDPDLSGAYDDKFTLTTTNWVEELGCVEEVIKRLQEDGY